MRASEEQCLITKFIQKMSSEHILGAQRWMQTSLLKFFGGPRIGLPVWLPCLLAAMNNETVESLGIFADHVAKVHKIHRFDMCNL